MVGFKAGGIDVENIVASLIDAERIPQLRLQEKQAQAKLKFDTVGRLRANLDALRTAAGQVVSTGLVKMSSTSSAPSSVSTTVGTGAQPGSVSFTVDRLATVHSLRSSRSAASSSSEVTTSARLGVSTSLNALGVRGLSVAATAATGVFATRVTQATTAATVTGASAPAASTTITPANRTLQGSLNGTAFTATIATGTYTAAQLATAVQTALDTAVGAGKVTATLDNTGMLQLSTVREGSAALLTINPPGAANTALSALGLTAATAAGTDGLVKFGTEVPVSVTAVEPAATVVGTALASSVTIGATNNTLQLDVNGTPRTLTIASGTYDQAGLLAAVQSAADAVSPGMLTASFGTTNTLRLSAPMVGSNGDISVTGGSALTSLGLSIGQRAGIAKVTQAESGTTVALGGGAVTFTLGGGLDVGDGSFAVVSTGDRTMASVASAIAGAGVGVSASAVKQNEGNWILQLTSRSSGVRSSLVLDSAAFGAVDGLVESSAAQDAKITVGSGGGAYSMQSSNNVFSGLMPGVDITTTAVSATAVTVNVSRNDAATADGVDALVSAANAALGAIAIQTKFDPKTQRASPLTGESSVRSLADRIRATVLSAVQSAGSVRTPSDAGLTIADDGTFKFDRTKFVAALTASERDVEAVLRRGGVGSPGVSYGTATDATRAGTYAVNVTQAATRATSGAFFAGGSPTERVIGVRMGSTSVTVNVAAGATPATIVSSLNRALSANGVAVTAETSGTGLRLVSNQYGSAGGFEMNLEVGVGSWMPVNGTDVAGTIDGQAAVGVGRRLSLGTAATSNAKGLAVDLDEGVSGAQSFTYQPGVASQLSTLIMDVTAAGGSMTVLSESYDKRMKDYNTQIDKYEDKLVARETALRRIWAQVQSNLATLQSQQSWLQGQVAAMNGSKQ